LPSVFLSSYIFLISTMPLFFRGLSYIIPASYYIQILRGIVLRGTTFADLWPQALVLTLMGCAAILLAAREFIRQNTA
jgi:ABC-2 type transport system permease protein